MIIAAAICAAAFTTCNETAKELKITSAEVQLKAVVLSWIISLEQKI